MSNIYIENFRLFLVFPKQSTKMLFIGFQIMPFWNDLNKSIIFLDLFLKNKR